LQYTTGGGAGPAGAGTWSIVVPISSRGTGSSCADSHSIQVVRVAYIRNGRISTWTTLGRNGY
jgi:hypothetical protein